MLKLIFSILRTLVFAVVILVAGALLNWNGKSVSQHIEYSLKRSRVMQQSTEWIERKYNGYLGSFSEGQYKRDIGKADISSSDNSASREEEDHVSTSQAAEFSEVERVKLRGLISELNGRVREPRTR